MKNLTSPLSPQEEKALRAFKEAVQKICTPEKWELKLFGSRARRSGDEDSDVDVLVLVEGEDNHQKVKIWDAAYFIFAETDIMISPLVLSFQQYENLKKRERLIAQDIERDGIRL